jgi:hypothetical protein
MPSSTSFDCQNSQGLLGNMTQGAAAMSPPRKAAPTVETMVATACRLPPSDGATDFPIAHFAPDNLLQTRCEITWIVLHRSDKVPDCQGADEVTHPRNDPTAHCLRASVSTEQ